MAKGKTAASAAATRAVVQIGRHGGRGFILAVGDKRYVVTAAHCFYDKLPVRTGRAAATRSPTVT